MKKIVVLGLALGLGRGVLASTPTITVYGEEVVVTATRREERLENLPTNISVITKEEIAGMNLPTAAELVETILGVTDVAKRGELGNKRTARIRSGGDTSKQVLVMLDGRRINSLSLGCADLSRIPATNIERIEVIRGPSSSLYGANALGGVINIITKKPKLNTQSSSYSILYGDFDTSILGVCLNNGGEKLATSFDFNRQETTNFRENNEYLNHDLSIKVEYAWKDDQKIRFDSNFYQYTLGLPGKNTTPIKDYDGKKERKAQSPNASLIGEGGYLQAEHQTVLGRLGKITAKAYGSLEKKRYEDPDSKINDGYKTLSRGAGIQLENPLGIVIGIESDWNRFKRRDLTKTPPEDKIKEKMVNSAIFFQKTTSLSLLRLICGLRYDLHSVFGGQVNPRLSTVLSLSDGLKLSLNFGRAFRAPTFEDLYSPRSSWAASPWGPAGDTQGNPDLKPEKAWGYDLGISSTKGPYWAITLFRSEVKDLIEWREIDPDPNYDKWRPINVGKAYHQGIEVETKDRLSPYLSQSLKYSYLESKGRNKKGEYKTLQYTPSNRLRYQIDYQGDQGFWLSFSYQYVDKQEWEDEYGRKHKLPQYGLFGLKVSQRFSNLELSFSAENLYDKRYQTRKDYPLAGRTISGMVKIDLPK